MTTHLWLSYNKSSFVRFSRGTIPMTQCGYACTHAAAMLVSGTLAATMVCHSMFPLQAGSPCCSPSPSQWKQGRRQAGCFSNLQASGETGGGRPSAAPQRVRQADSGVSSELEPNAEQADADGPKPMDTDGADSDKADSGVTGTSPGAMQWKGPLHIAQLGNGVTFASSLQRSSLCAAQVPIQLHFVCTEDQEAMQARYAHCRPVAATAQPAAPQVGPRWSQSDHFGICHAQCAGPLLSFSGAAS